MIIDQLIDLLYFLLTVSFLLRKGRRSLARGQGGGQGLIRIDDVITAGRTLFLVGGVKLKIGRRLRAVCSWFRDNRESVKYTDRQMKRDRDR